MKRTLASIEAEIEKLKATADKLRQAEVAGVVARMRAAIDHYGLSAEDLGFGPNGAARKARTAVGRKVATGSVSVGVAKYRDPVSGKTWTGHGKPPNWISGVADRAALLINGQAPSEAGAKRGPATRVAKSMKGPKVGTPKYQDPASGKTWTGMGKPPAWIAGASDRTAFLIGASKAEPFPERVEAAPVETALAEAPAASGRTGRKAAAKPAVKRAAKKPAAKRKAPAGPATSAG